MSTPFSTKNDEIDIAQLIKQLWRSRLSIVVITAAAIVAAFAYISVVSPTYQSQAILLPPAPSALQSYNLVARLADPEPLKPEQNDNKKENETLVASLVNDITVDDVYLAFQRVLNSQNLKQDFFVKHYLAHYHPNATALEKEQLFDRFAQQLRITLPRNDTEFETRISFELDDAERSAAWLNQYVEQALSVSRARLLNNLKVQRSEQIRVIESRLAVLRNQAKTDNDNRLQRVEDALRIAQGINLEHPSNSGNLITSYSGETMYLRGAQALSAELDLLQRRENFDPYIAELPLLQRQLDMIQLSVLPGDEFQTAQIDLVAAVPQRPIAPKKALILLIAAVLGFMLACMIALVRGMLRR